MANHGDRKRLLFFRNYRAFQGGHLKVFDYFNHAKLSKRYAPEIFVTPESRPDHLWRSESGLVARYDPEQADCLFIAGMDWNALLPFPGIENDVPVINLIQHVRHAFPADPRYAFLSRRAIRICVSHEVADALRQTGNCNGPVHAIPNGIDCTLLSVGQSSVATDVFIAGLKKPGLARGLDELLQGSGFSVDCVVEPLERSEFLQRMARAQIAVTLPREEEGFFLPALEAMMLGRAVICPDCVGNRGFCIDGDTCLMPPPKSDALAAAVMKLMADASYRNALVARAKTMGEQFDIQRERVAFLDILNGI